VPFDGDPDDGLGDEVDDIKMATGEHEVAAGTRRVSAQQRLAGQPRVKRQPRRVKPNLLQGAHRRSYRMRIGALLVLVLAAALIWFLAELFQPFHGSPHGHVTVTIPHDSGASKIGDLLSADGVISSGFFFEIRARLEGDRGKLLSGTYHLQKGMSYGAVLTALTTPPKAAPTTELTLIPGKSRKQIDTLLRSQHISGSYLASTRHSTLLNPTTYGAPRSTPDLEGFLFPDTYQLRTPITVTALVADQLAEFKKQFASVNLGYAKQHNLTAYDVLIIASMIEGEASTEQDRLDVSSVIYNRLRLGMPLGLDDTTRFATGNYTQPLTDSQLNSSSPYNTRLRHGLTPTPIDNPSLASIKAAANPPKTNYLYFVVTPCGKGSMSFTNNYSKFLKDSAAYQSARSARGGKSPENCR
jgi:UPF0755 protein